MEADTEVHEAIEDDGAKSKTIETIPVKDDCSIQQEMGTTEPLNRVMSPNSELTSPDSLGSEARSDDMWSGSSASSSRRLLPNEALLRKKIRNQAKAALIKRTEALDASSNVQQSNIIEDGDDDLIHKNSDELDEEIKRSLQIGAKYMNDDEESLMNEELSENVLHRTVEGETDDNHSDRHNFEVGYLKPKPRPEEDITNFSKLCTVYKRQPFLLASSEDGYPCMNCSEKLLQIRDKLDKYLLTQRFGDEFFAENIDNGSKHIIRHQLKPEKIDSQMQLHHYAKAEDWKTTALRFNFENYIPLDIRIGSLAFAHHWLFVEEDVICNSIRELHSIQTVKANELLHLLHETINLKQQYDSLKDNDQRREQLLPKLETLFAALNEKQRKYLKLGNLICSKWRTLEMIRKRQGYSSTTLQLQLMPFNEQQEFASAKSEFSNFIQSLNETPIYTISEMETDQAQNKPKQEIDRLALIGQIRIQIHIFFNNILVCKTEFVSLNGQFLANIDQNYRLQVYEVPESITATVFEKNQAGSIYELAKIGIPLPDDDSAVQDIPELLESLQFACDKVISGQYNSIGCGNDSPCISGTLNCVARCQKKASFRTQAERNKRILSSKVADEKNKTFELIPAEVRLCSDEEFDCQMRFHPAVGNKFSGRACSDLISSLNELKKQKLFATAESRINGSSLTSSRLDSLKSSAADFITLIRSQLCERFYEERDAKSFYDIVREDPAPTIFGAFSTIFKGGDTTRKLKPMRKASTSELFPADLSYRLIVNIQSAVNLPVRNDGKLQPFVEVTFQKTTASTQVVDGGNPNWQESLEVSLAETLRSQTDLKTITDKIQLFIFDQVVTKLDSDDREPNTVHEQLEKHYLGCVQIPFSSLKINDKIDGYLRIETPIYLSSYRLSKNPSYIKILVTLLPKICSRPQKVTRGITGLESDETVFRCLQWQKNLSERFPKRRYVCLMHDPNGRQIFASRFLRPVEPPPCITVSPTPQFAERACRIASCIPCISDYSSFTTVFNIWATLDQLLAIGFGDEGEHAVVLCCWLLSAGIQSYIILGNALPEGIKGAYVVAILPEKSLLLNPTNGSFYSSDDPLCPLTSVGTLITVDNVYGNIQSHVHPSQVQFDLKNRSHWQPVLEKGFSAGKSLQPEALIYRQIEKPVIAELRSNLERTIKITFDKSRLYGVPQWSLLAARILRGVLAEIEVLLDTDVVDRRLAELKSSYRINTIIIRQRYTSVDDLVQKIIHLNVHNNSNHQAQFALAVHFESYSNNILSAIIAVASLSPY